VGFEDKEICDKKGLIIIFLFILLKYCFLVLDKKT